VSMLTLYKNEVFPLLQKRGFVGTVATAEKKLERGTCWAHAKGKDGELHVRVLGYFDMGSGLSTRIEESLDIDVELRESAIAALRNRLTGVITAIDQEQAAAPVRKVMSLEDSLVALLERLRKKQGGLPIRVQAEGRGFAVERGTETIRVDRAELFTLVHYLWQDAAFTPGRDPTYAVREVELTTYILELAKRDQDEARALYLLIFGAYMTHLDAKSPLWHLFEKPVWAAQHLNSASTGTHLIRRALPHAADGPVVDRMAAISTILVAIHSMHQNDKGYEGSMESLNNLTGLLNHSTSPYLREAAWLLNRVLSTRRTKK
jgi:hypothetical protein